MFCVGGPVPVHFKPGTVKGYGVERDEKGLNDDSPSMYLKRKISKKEKIPETRTTIKTGLKKKKRGVRRVPTRERQGNHCR